MRTLQLFELTSPCLLFMLSQGVIQHVFFGIGKNSVYKTISEKGVDFFAELVFIGGDDENTSIV